MNKTAIITGGATGIGTAISSLFAKNGYNVIINYNTSKTDALALKDQLITQGYSAEIFKADVSNSIEADELINFATKSFGKIDVLINNAGISQQKLITDITDSDWDKMISVNLTGCFNCCRAASKFMVSKHFGSIINISSMWGLTGASCESHYSASKAGIIGLTKALAKELGPSNIRVNCVAPGVIDTKMNSHLTKEALSELSDTTPLCRIGTPEEVAKAVYFLASDNASFITGQILSVDGGFTI